MSKKPTRGVAYERAGERRHLLEPTKKSRRLPGRPRSHEHEPTACLLQKVRDFSVNKPRQLDRLARDEDEHTERPGRRCNPRQMHRPAVRREHRERVEHVRRRRRRHLVRLRVVRRGRVRVGFVELVRELRLKILRVGVGRRQERRPVRSTDG